MPQTGVQPKQVELVEASYQRCAERPEFYATFYESFLASDARVPPMFAGTKFERQNRLLRHALGLLIIYAKRENPALLERIAVRHNRHGVGAPPELYGKFIDALVDALERHDPGFTPELGEAWRRVMAPGVAYMQSRY